MLPQYSNVALHNDCNSFINIRYLFIMFALWKILQSRCDHVDLTTCMSGENRRQSTRPNCDRIHCVSAHAVSQIHDFVNRAHLGLSKLAVSWIHERSDGLVTDFVIDTKRQNQMINEAGDVQGRRADYGELTTGVSVLQHQFAVRLELCLLQYCQWSYLYQEMKGNNCY